MATSTTTAPTTVKPATRLLRVASIPTLLLLMGTGVVAAGLRFYCLDCYGLWYDEVASIDAAQRGLVALLTDRFGWMSVQTPLHYLLIWLALKPVDPTTTAVLVRLPSVVAGLLTPFAVYGLGKEMFGRAQGLVGAFMMALSAVHISHSQDARPYVFLALLTALSVYCLLVAERTGEGRWWLLFAASTAANLLMTYQALALAMPALAPYLLWVLYRAWRGRGRLGAARLRSVLLAFGIVAAVGLLVLLDASRVPRTAPNLSLFSLDSVGDQFGRMINRLGQVGVDREVEKWLQWSMAALALLGAALAVYLRRLGMVLLCASMLLVPSVLMALLKTTNTVFQRYVLFTMPFYFLLIANALVELPALARLLPAGRTTAMRVLGLLRGALSGGVAALLVLGLYVYFNPDSHRQLSFLPDYRSAARYLQQQATPGDLIILLDEPPQSMQVFDLYWHSAPPAPTFEAIDPRLPTQQTTSRIFWVLAYQQNDPAYIKALARADAHQFAAVQTFDRLLVLREDNPGPPLNSLERMQTRLAAVNPAFTPSLQPVNTLHAALLEASGHSAQAADAYRTSGPYYLSGDEYLSTAEGFAARGNTATAWREGMMSLFMEPYKPQVHAWLAQMLSTEGYPAQSKREQQIADALSK